MLSGSSGAGAEIKVVNSPPDVSKAMCKVSPQTGVAAQTDFVITCHGAEDEQLPLFYGFEYNCNDKWALLTTSTSGNLTLVFLIKSFKFLKILP